MKIEGLLTDEAILAELGGRLAQRRLELQLTQEMLASNPAPHCGSSAP